MEIYVVIGTTGEYGDRQEWLVGAYRSEILAQRCVNMATQEAKAWEATREGQFDDPPEGYSIWDPKMRMDYSGTTYRYEAIAERG